MTPLGWKQKGKHKNHKESSSERMRCQIGQNGETVEGFQKVEEESKTHALYQKDPKNATKGPSEDMGWPRECGRGGKD